MGAGTTVTLIDVKEASTAGEKAPAADRARFLGLDPRASGLLKWDVFDAVLTPGDLILLLSWHPNADADSFEKTLSLPMGTGLRRVRIVRDYGMFDRREAPQYYPAVERPADGS